jgi:SAM-dependent methyltransferase
VLSDTRLCPRPARIHVCEACQHLRKVHTPGDVCAIQELYAHYEAHHLSRGEEQPAFMPGREPLARSRVALERCRHLFPPRGRLLDFGCGNGAVLKSASPMLEGWELHGSDLNDQYQREILAIPGVAGFHHGSEAIPEGPAFDVVVLWHVLEHLEEPLAVLEKLKRLIKPGGFLLLSLPDVERTIFDLAVLDHVSHFSQVTLSHLLTRAGLEVAVDGQDWIHNCLTALCRLPRLSRNGGAATGPQATEGRAHVSHLNHVVRQFETRAAQRDYALFGAGMSSIWLLGQLSRLPAILLDEDAAKAGQSFHGVPICPPVEIQARMDILMPFSPATAQRIAARLRAQSEALAACDFVVPELTPPQAAV